MQVPPNWSITQAAMHASELQTQLQSSLWQLDRLLNLYSDTAVPSVNIADRLRAYAGDLQLFDPYAPVPNGRDAGV